MSKSSSLVSFEMLPGSLQQAIRNLSHLTLFQIDVKKSINSRMLSPDQRFGEGFSSSGGSLSDETDWETVPD